MSRSVFPHKAIQACLPKPAKEPPMGPGWIHEIKHDGYRILARRNTKDVWLYTRNGSNFADRFPRIVEAVKSPPVRSCFIDGEAIVVDVHDNVGFVMNAPRSIFFDARQLTGRTGRPLRSRLGGNLLQLAELALQSFDPGQQLGLWNL